MLSEAAPLPFPVEGDAEVNEDVRLKYRYLDLRREETAARAAHPQRGRVPARDVMHEHGFVDVETPYLTRSTPEGARDFLVPVRLRPGNWYALPQSPQLFKQLLMVGGMERYYQIARCFRDEDFRADRQPEFTQLDIEMCFVDQDDVIAVGEDDRRRALWREIVGYEIPTPLPRMTYAEAMARYGSDKPDLRFGLELTDLTELLRRHPVPGLPGPVRRRGRHARRRGADPPRARRLAGLGQVARRPRAGLRARSATDGELGGPVAKNLSDAERAGLAAAVGAQPGDACSSRPGTAHASQELLGAARLEIGRRCGLIDESPWSFLWVVDAPMFEQTDGGGWTAVHHPFTSPQAGVGRHLRHRPGRRAGLRLRHRVQRQRDRRRLDPYPPRRRCSSGCST